MKKFVAILLAVATILGCVACSKAEETTKKKKKKTKKTTTESVETEESTDEPTDETTDEPTDAPTSNPTDDTTEAPTDTTEDPNETGGVYETWAVPDPFTMSTGLTIRHDLEKLQIGRDLVYKVWGDLDPQSEFEEVRYVKARTDMVSVYEDGPLADAVSYKFTSLADDAASMYAERLEKFLSSQQSGTLERDTSYNVNTTVFRADSEYFSSMMEIVDYGLDFYDVQRVGANYRYSDGSFIDITEVVTDMAALTSYVKDKMDPYRYDYDETVQNVEDGACAWALLYDGIYIENFGKVPVIGNEYMFDLSYFGATPETYALLADKSGEILWDVNEDQFIDDIRISLETDASEESVESLTISVNADQYVFTPNEIAYLADDYEFAENLEHYLVRTEYGYFLIVSLESYYWYHTCIFRVDENGVTFRTDGNYYVLEAFDPDNILVGDTAYITGLEATRDTRRFSDIGILASTTIFKDVYSGPYKTKIDLPAQEVDLTDLSIGADVTVPAGTMVAPILLDENTGLLIMRILDPDESQTSYVVMETGGEYDIAGYHSYEALYGVIFGE